MDLDLPALEINQLSFNYDRTPVLWDVSLAIPRASLVGIIGPNGAGKSTLLKASLGLIQPLHGSVLFFGKPLQSVRKSIGYVPQRESVDWDFPITVLELVLMGGYGRLGLCRRPGKSEKEKARHYLEIVGMYDYKDHQISELSGGQQQRVFLARALLQEADLYFMDEPFVGVDFATEKVIVDLLHDLQKQGKTVLVVHHDLDTVKKYFNWVVLLNMRVVASGPTDAVFTPEFLDKTMHKRKEIFSEVERLSQFKNAGLYR